MTQLALPLNTLKRDWLDRSIPAVCRAMNGKEFTSDDLHRVLDLPAHENWYGVLMAQLRNQAWVTKMGYRPSQRREANGRVVAVWRVN